MVAAQHKGEKNSRVDSEVGGQFNQQQNHDSVPTRLLP